jgi:hypothetical protein
MASWMSRSDQEFDDFVEKRCAPLYAAQKGPSRD